MCVPHPKPLFIFCGICLFAFHRDSFLLFIYSHIFSIKQYKKSVSGNLNSKTPKRLFPPKGCHPGCQFSKYQGRRFHFHSSYLCRWCLITSRNSPLVLTRGSQRVNSMHGENTAMMRNVSTAIISCLLDVVMGTDFSFEPNSVEWSPFWITMHHMHHT